MLGCWVIMCWIGLCGYLDLEVMSSDRAKFRTFRGTNDKGWLWLRFCACGAVGVVFVILLYLYRFVIRHTCLVLLIAWYCILSFERLREFY